MTTNGEARTETRERFGSYSPDRRTAVVFGGTGAHGAYHAGVLRALQETGVKIDLVAGHGIGAGSAALAAIDGSARLWDEKGVWRSTQVRRLYHWKRSARGFAVAAIAGAALLAGVLLYLILGGAGLPSVTMFIAALAIAVVALGGAAVAALARRDAPSQRRPRGAWYWQVAGAPLDASSAGEVFSGAIWEVIRGAAPAQRPSRTELGRRYSEALAENLGQPGFRELLLVVNDLEARRDTVAALLRDPFRQAFLAPRAEGDRRSDVLDLAGVGRVHAIDVLAAAMTPPLLCDPAPVTFAADSYWRGETHRMCDRPGAMYRLLEETAAAGVTQAIVVSAVSQVAVPHGLRVPRADPRGRLGEFQSSAEAAALRDAFEMARLRFDSVHLITPAYNPLGPFDVQGVYDQASDRRQDLTELMQRGYEDAYRQFIEPVVGASGEQLASVSVPE